MTNVNIDDANGLRAAINAVNSATSGAQTITIDNSLSGMTFTWAMTSTNLPPIILQPGVSLTINGPTPSPVTLDGSAGSSLAPPFRGFVVEAGSVVINNMNFNNLISKGGSGGNGGGGGGGGLGAGGACFIGSIPSLSNPSSVSFSNVSFSNNSAVGGAGGTIGSFGSSASGGGGGGMGGSGGNGSAVSLLGPEATSGGGGGGLFGAGGNANINNYGGAGGGGLFFPGGSSVGGQQNASGGGGGGTTSAGGNGGNGNGGGGGGPNGGGGGTGGAGGVGGNGGPGGGGGGGGWDFGFGTGAGGNGGTNGGGGGAGASAGIGTGRTGGGNGGINGGGGSDGGGNNGNRGSPGVSAGSGGYGGGCAGAASLFNGTITSQFPGASIGGFGGGGGGAPSTNTTTPLTISIAGAPGGFGAGGGGGSNSGAGGVSSGFGGNGGGGTGSSTGLLGGGGGGAALGGSFFVQSGTTLTIGDNTSLSQAATPLTMGIGGSGNGNASSHGSNGSTFGQDLFLNAGGKFIYKSPAGSSFTITNLDDGGGSAVADTGLFLDSTNTGILILAGTGAQKTHFRGNVEINGGTLEVSGDPSSFTSAITNDAALNFSNVPTSNFSGSISGTGTLAVSSSGILTFLGTNIYTGNTAITSGTLQAGGNNVLSSSSIYTITSPGVLDINGKSQTLAFFAGNGSVKLGTGGALTISNTSSDSFSGSITETGASNIIKAGSGLLSLGGSVSVNLLTVNAGQLNLNGTSDFSQLVISNGTLGGTGTVSVATLNNSATIVPGTGTATGILHITGNVNYLSGSTHQAEVSPSSANQLVVVGNISIDSGTTLLIVVDPGTYAPGTLFTIIDASNITGQFTNIVNASSVPFQVVYDPLTRVQLLIPALPSTSSSPIGGNAIAAAAAFATLSASNPNVASLINFFSTASADEAQCNFDNMQPALYNAIPIVQEATTTAVRKTLTDRLQEIHGVRCPKAQNPSTVLGLSPMAVALSPFDSSIKENHMNEQNDERSFTFWLTPIGNFTKQRSRSSHFICDNTKVGFKSDSWGSTFGFDAHPFEHFILGGALSYVHTDLDWKESLAKSRTNSVFASLFSSLFNRYIYLDLAFLGAYDHFDSSRKIVLSNMSTTIHQRAEHKEDAGEYDLYAGLGFTWNKRSWQLNPFINVDYQHLHQGNYKESGAQSINLKVQKRNSDLLRTEAGASMSLCQKSTDKASFSFIEQIKLSYVNETRYNGKTTKSQFIGSPESATFEVKGFWPNRDLISPGASFQLVFPKKHISFDLRYNGEFGKKWSNQTGSLEILYAF